MKEIRSKAKSVKRTTAGIHRLYDLLIYWNILNMTVTNDYRYYKKKNKNNSNSNNYNNSKVRLQCTEKLVRIKPATYNYIKVFVIIILISLLKTQIARVSSLRKQPTFGHTTTGFPAKWRPRNERRNPILMTRHYSDLDRAAEWSCRLGNLIQPIRSTIQIWVVTSHQYGISALVSQTFFGGETSGSVAKCPLFPQATM